MIYRREACSHDIGLRIKFTNISFKSAILKSNNFKQQIKYSKTTNNFMNIANIVIEGKT